MTTVIRHGDRLVALVKGAPEWVLEQQHALPGGRRHAREPGRREARQAVAGSSCATRPARPCGRWPSATRCCRPTRPPTRTACTPAATRWRADLVFVGFVAIRDPLRDDVKDAVAECRRAGIEVKMITGDNVETARAIGYDIGLIDRRDAPIDTPDARRPDQRRSSTR